MVRAVYPGSFDPLTLGHLDIAIRASQLFTELIVAVYDAPPKRLTFDTDERIQLWKDAIPADRTNIEVAPYTGLTVDLALSLDAQVLVRGLRALSDYEYELEMALTNKRMAPQVESIYMMSTHDFLFLSSSRIKEIWGLGRAVKGMVPENVDRALRAKFNTS